MRPNDGFSPEIDRTGLADDGCGVAVDLAEFGNLRDGHRQGPCRVESGDVDRRRDVVLQGQRPFRGLPGDQHLAGDHRPRCDLDRRPGLCAVRFAAQQCRGQLLVLAQDDVTGCRQGFQVLGGHDHQVDAPGGHGGQVRGRLQRREVEPAARRCGHEVRDCGDPPRPGLRSARAEHDEPARPHATLRVRAVPHRRGDRVQQRDQDVDPPAAGLEQEVQHPCPVEHPVRPRRRTRRDRGQHLAVPERCEPAPRAPQVRRAERRLGNLGSAVEHDVDEHVAGPAGRVQAGGRGVPVTGTPARRGRVQQPAGQRVLLLGGGEAGDRPRRGELGGDRRLQLLELVGRQVGGVVLDPPSAGPATVVEGGEGQLSEPRARLVAAHLDLRPPHQGPLRTDFSAGAAPRGATAGRRVSTAGSCRA